MLGRHHQGFKVDSVSMEVRNCFNLFCYVCHHSDWAALLFSGADVGPLVICSWFDLILHVPQVDASVKMKFCLLCRQILCRLNTDLAALCVAASWVFTSVCTSGIKHVFWLENTELFCWWHSPYSYLCNLINMSFTKAIAFICNFSKYCFCL